MYFTLDKILFYWHKPDLKFLKRKGQILWVSTEQEFSKNKQKAHVEF